MKQTLLNKCNFIISHVASRMLSPTFRHLRRIKIASPEATVKTIVANRMSIARFGDGELTLMAGNDTDFQKFDEQIAAKLKRIIANEEFGLLVGLPYVWKHPWRLKYRAFEFWGAYLSNNLKQRITSQINLNSFYYDSTFTRFYIDYRSSGHARKMAKLVKKIWDNRDICFIEGEYSRLGVGNDLFDNARSIQRIICPATNAFEVYDHILSEAVKLPKDTLMLIALGMTATCVAYDLHKAGYQAIDIGHIDVEYEWYKMKAREKVAIPGKFVAESTKNNPLAKEVDKKYLSQIICRIDS